jgi:ribosomal protein S18 acetylase RimI-like enzyme
MPSLRNAATADAALITSHRSAMFHSMPNPNQPALDEMSRAFEPWVRERLADGRYLGWIAEENCRAVASAGMIILDWPPHALHPSMDKRAYVLNVYVEPEFRKRGLAHELLERCMAEARRRQIRVVTLHAAEAGRSVYEKFGFRPSNEMMYVETRG